jgi:hypothetical protein
MARRLVASRSAVAITAISVCALLSACGTTVQLAAGNAAPPQSEASQLGGLDPSPAQAGAIDTNPSAAVPSDDTQSTSVGPSRSARPTSRAADGTFPTQSTTDGAGGHATSDASLTPSTFKIGLQYSANANAALAAIGSKGVKGDPKQINNAVIDWINRHGGIGGRRAIAAYNNLDATASPAAESQSACTQWAQDNHVQFAVPTSAVEDNNLMRACLGRAGIPALYGNLFTQTLDSSFAANPLWFEPNNPSLDTYAKTYVAGLDAQGFFDSGKVGIVYYNQPPFSTALNRVLLPALKKAGVATPFTFAANINGVSDLASGTTQMASAVLNFHSRGINRVMFFEPWVGYFAFLTVASTQGYHPLYGFSSQEAINVARQLGLLPATQLVGSYLVSWFPAADIGNPTHYLGPRLKLCQSIFRKAQVAIPNYTSDATGYIGALVDCEDLLLVWEAYKNAPARLGPADFGLGLNSLGAKLPLASHPFATLSTSKHWGASQWWPGRYSTKLGYFVVTGPPHPIH